MLNFTEAFNYISQIETWRMVKDGYILHGFNELNYCMITHRWENGEGPSLTMTLQSIKVPELHFHKSFDEGTSQFNKMSEFFDVNEQVALIIE